MSVSNELYLNLTANKEECIAVLLKLAEVGGFTSVNLNRKYIMLFQSSKEQLEEELNDHDFTNPLSISTVGPYGRFELFDGLNHILVETCKEVPVIEFDGVLNSTYEVDGSERIIEFTYKNKTLKYEDSDYFETYNDDMYLKYISKKLSYKRFTTWFKLDREEFDETMYEDIVLEYFMDGSFFEMDYDEMMDILPESRLKEERFYDLMEKIEELEILSYEDFEFEMDGFEPKRKDWVKHTVKI